MFAMRFPRLNEGPGPSSASIQSQGFACEGVAPLRSTTETRHSKRTARVMSNLLTQALPAVSQLGKHAFDGALCFQLAVVQPHHAIAWRLEEGAEEQPFVAAFTKQITDLAAKTNTLKLAV